MSTPVDPPPPPGRATRAGRWAVVEHDGEYVALSRICRHQLADLSAGGKVTADGCLVCPWHGSTYRIADGEMVRGPQGFLTYRGHIPGYGALVKAYARFLPLRRRPVVEREGRLVVEEEAR